MVRDRAGKAALVLALIASVLVIVLDAAGSYLPALIDAFDFDARLFFNVYGAFRRVVVGVVALIAVVLAGVSIRTPGRPRGLASAALALGGFHLVWSVALILTGALEPSGL